MLSAINGGSAVKLRADLASSDSDRGASNVSGVVRVVDSIADLRNVDKTRNSRVRVMWAEEPGDFGGGIFQLHASTGGGAANDDGINIGAADDGWWRRERKGPTLVHWFGKIGNGSDDTAKFEKALAASPTVKVMNPDTAYLCVNLSLPRNAKIIGQNKYETNFVGDGVNPVFLLGDGADSTLRRMRLKSIGVDNAGAECVKLRTSPSWEFIDCRFSTTASATKNAVDAELSYRGKLKDCIVNASGGAWAFQALNNCNGLEVTGNTISGGSAGGAINVGQSQAIEIVANIIESSLKGIYVASGSETGNGLCTAVKISTNYIEQSQNPIAIATQYIVRGGRCESNYIGNTLKTVIATRDTAIKFGRIQSYTITNNTIYLSADSDENMFEAVMNSATGEIYGNTIANNAVVGTALEKLKLSGTQSAVASVKRLLGADNYFDFTDSKLASAADLEYISPTFTANVSRSAVAYVAAADMVLGGRVKKVEIIEATGTLTGCSLYLGRTGSNTETVNQALDALSLSNGRAEIALATSAATLNTSEDNTIRIVAGSGTGTFRIRVRYRGT